MHIQTATHWLPKRGSAAGEYEDAFWPPSVRAESQLFRCAVADGATEASFSRQWARSLTEAWCHNRLAGETFLDDLAVLQTDWRRLFGDKVSQLSWYAEQKAQQGAFSSLIGLVVHEAPHPEASHGWEAIAIGDSNLFQVGDDELVAAFPLTRAEQFTSSPYLVSSNPGTASPELLRHVALTSGELEANDTFYLMTDALACWFAGCVERGDRPWQRLDALPDGEGADAAFRDFVTRLREQEDLHNDDVTLLRLCVDGEPLAKKARPTPAGAVAAATSPAHVPWQVELATTPVAPTPTSSTGPVELEELTELDAISDDEIKSRSKSTVTPLAAAPTETAVADQQTDEGSLEQDEPADLDGQDSPPEHGGDLDEPAPRDEDEGEGQSGGEDSRATDSEPAPGERPED